MTFELPCVPVLRKSCCCGCSVRSGSILLGWLGLFAFVAQFVCVALILINLDDLGVPHHYHGGVKGICYAVLVMFLKAAFFNATFLYGTHSEKPSYMLPFLMYTLFLYVFSLIVTLYFGISLLAHDTISGLVTIFVGQLTYVVAAYFWVILYSYYQQLEQKQNPKDEVQYEKCIA